MNSTFISYKVVLTFNYLDDMKATLHPCGILALCRTLLVFPSVMYVTWFPTLSSQFISVLSLKSASSCFHLTKITQMGEFFLSSSNKNCRRKSHLRALSSDIVARTLAVYRMIVPREITPQDQFWPMMRKKILVVNCNLKDKTVDSLY